MTAGNTTTLYSPQLLALAAALAKYPLDKTFARHAEARSRTCGSTIALGLNVDQYGAITRIGMKVSACAVGQSSAAILAQSIIGHTSGDLERARCSIDDWLRGDGPLPQWPGFDALAAARDHAGRHNALTLPWNAAIKALFSDPASG